jgi:hypothetical protein
MAEIRIFKLNVKNDKINWYIQKALSDDYIKELDKGDENLELSSWYEERIDLLVHLLQLLAPMLREGPREDVVKVSHEIIGILGEHLYEVLFKGNKIRSQFNSQLNELKDGNLELLRVELEFEGKHEEKLARWPWEYLRSPKDVQTAYSGEFLAAVTELMLNRRLFLSGMPPVELKTSPPIKILVIVSKPRDLDTVHCDRVLEKLRELSKTSEGKIEVRELIEDPPDGPSDYTWKVTRENFQKAVQGEGPVKELKGFKPHIIHFIGHGQCKEGHGEIALVFAGGQKDWISDEKFAGWVKQKNLKLVFLQACESASIDPYRSVSGMAWQLAHKNIPAVIAMQDKIENEVANTFTCCFYQELAEGKPIDLAVKAGRRAVENLPEASQRIAFGVPVLYLRSYAGMIDYEALPPGRSTNLSTRTSIVETYRSRQCPRCSTLFKKANYKTCTNCGLRVICKCGESLDDPFDKFCGVCGDPILQPPWQEKVPYASR